MSIYTKERVKVTVGTVLISLAVIIGFWALLFATDYVLYRNKLPLLFSKTSVQDIDGKHYTIENGLGYYVITNTENVPEFYLFGNKIK